jgi:hypothetical protein
MFLNLIPISRDQEYNSHSRAGISVDTNGRWAKIVKWLNPLALPSNQFLYPTQIHADVSDGDLATSETITLSDVVINGPPM